MSKTYVLIAYDHTPYSMGYNLWFSSTVEGLIELHDGWWWEQDEDPCIYKVTIGRSMRKLKNIKFEEGVDTEMLMRKAKTYRSLDVIGEDQFDSLQYCDHCEIIRRGNRKQELCGTCTFPLENKDTY